jgi:transposase InsO family protein
MTYVKLSTGSWVYVTFMTDAYARKIVACHAAATMTRQLVTDTLKLAIEARALEGHPVEAGLIHHSDHESQYTAIHYGEQLVIEGIVPSFGSVGDAYDNALAETINGLYKTECVTQDGPFHTIDQVMDATLDWAHWWNNQRLLERLDYQTPVEIETQYYENQKSPENE